MGEERHESRPKATWRGAVSAGTRSRGPPCGAFCNACEAKRERRADVLPRGLASRADDARRGHSPRPTHREGHRVSLRVSFPPCFAHSSAQLCELHEARGSPRPPRTSSRPPCPRRLSQVPGGLVGNAPGQCPSSSSPTPSRACGTTGGSAAWHTCPTPQRPERACAVGPFLVLHKYTRQHRPPERPTPLAPQRRRSAHAEAQVKAR